MILKSAVLEINQKKIIDNYKFLNSISKKTLTGATIKANAYGLGDIKIFKLLFKVGCRYFFVANLYEALKIRESDSRGKIFILNEIHTKDIKFLKKYKNLIPIINSDDSFKRYKRIFKNYISKVHIGLHLDTGINRLGLNEEEFLKIMSNKDLNISIILSHLASADENKNKYNLIQRNKFEQLIKKIQKKPLRSLSNSAGIILGTKYQYDLSRPGIALYGGHNNNSSLKKKIKPVIKLKAQILQIKELKKNEYVGYNQTFKTNKNTTVAILGIGYADGISRLLSNKGYAFYKNFKFKIIGRVSMDSITIDISKHKSILKIGMYLELINYKYDIEKFASQCGTISNEILTSISNRVKKVYI